MFMEIIDESLSVSDVVKEMTNEIKHEILFRAKNNQITISKERNRLIKKGIFTYNTKNKLNIHSFKVKYVIYVYEKENEYYKDYENGIISLDCECDYEKGLLTVN